jgi:hypothetical protein
MEQPETVDYGKIVESRLLGLEVLRMAHPRVSAKRFTKIHFFMQNIVNMADIRQMLGCTDRK